MPDAPVDLVNALRRCGLFRGVPDGRLHTLAADAEYRGYGPDAVIVREGEPADAMFVVADGAVRVYAARPDGREIVLARLEAGEHFGEQALLPAGTGRRNASVRAAGAVRLARITRTAFQALLEADDVLRERVLEVGAEQLRARLQQLSPFAAGIGVDRVASRRRALAAGEVLFRQGDDAEALYFVAAGRLAVWTEADARRSFIRYVDAGGCVGELAVVHRAPRSATVIAAEPAEVLEISGAAFEEIYRTSPALKQQLATLESVYEMPRRGIVTQHAGSFMNRDAITSIYHLGDGRVFAASRVIGDDLYTVQRLGMADGVETLTWREHERRWRELHVTSQGVVVALTARGDWPDAHAMHLFVLDGGRLETSGRAQFLESGALGLAVPPLIHDLLCHCVHVTVATVRAAVAGGAATVAQLQKSTGCGTVCGSCVPGLAEMLGAEEWVVADVVAMRDEAPDVRSFELRPRHAGYEAPHPGQHVVVEGTVHGLRMRRPYTVSSLPDKDGPLRITVKREPLGAFSGWLFDERAPEQPLRISRPRGNYVIDVAEGPVVCLVAGIGVTPALAAAQAATRRPRTAPFLIHYSGRSRERMPCVKELEALDPARVQVIVRETSREGRLDRATIGALAERVRGAQWYLCGPATYVEEVGEMVRGAGITREHVHVERFTPVGAAPAAANEARAALSRYLLAPPTRPRRPRLVGMLRRVGVSLTDLANRHGPASLANPLRWLESRIGRAAGLDPAVPRELLAVMSGLCNGPFAFQLRAFERLGVSAADGDTFAYWIPAVPFVRFPAPAVETGWRSPGEGRLVPVYITRSRTAVDRLLRSATDIDRSPIPYHFVQQVVGRAEQPSCPMRKAAGLIAGAFRHNATWSEDRASATETFAYESIEDFSDGIAATLDDVCGAIDVFIDAAADRVVDLDVLLCRIAQTVVVRAVFGDVQSPDLDALGRALSNPVERLLAHVRHFAMGGRSIPSDYVECQRRARTTWRAMVDLLRDVDRRGGVSERARARPTVRLLLESAGDADRGYDRLYTLFLPLIVAGHETTGHTIAWAFYELARDPRLERSILLEIARFRAERGREHLTPGDYDERPLTWALIAETLRRHPPVQSVARTALKPGAVPPDPHTGSGGFRFPSGTVFGISIIGVHLDPRRWSEPRAFRPARWLSAVDDTMSPAEQGRAVRQAMRTREEACDWIPFAAGESRCPGHHFYTHEFFLVLDALLTRYRFEPSEPGRDVADSETMVVGPEPGAMAVRIRRR